MVSDSTPQALWLTERQAVQLLTGGSFEVRSISAETASPSPGAPEESAVNVTASWGGAVITLTRSAHRELRAAQAWWGARRVELVGVRTPASGRWEVGVVFTEWRESNPPRTVRVERRGEVPLAEGVSLVFEGHSHKSVDPETESPLMVALTYRMGTQSIESNVNLFPPREAEWQWERWSFRLVDYDYGAWMELEVRDLTPRPLQVAP